MIDRAPPRSGELARGDGPAMAAIARGGIASLLGSGVSAASQLVVVVVVTRWYSPADAGALFAATALFLIVVAVVQLGTDQGLVRFLAGHRARGQHHELRRILRIGLLPVVAASLVGCGALLWLAGSLGRLLGDGDAGTVGSMLRVLALAVPIAAVHEALLAATRGLGSLRSTVVVERVVRPLLQPLAIVAVAISDLGVAALAPAWAAPYAVAVAGSALALRSTLRRVEAGSPTALAAGGTERMAPPSVDADLTDAPVIPATLASEQRNESLGAEFWSFTAGRAVARVLQVALQRVDILLVAALLGTGAVAVYTAATRFIAVGMLANQAIQQVIQPRLAGMFARGEVHLAGTVLRRTTVWLVALVWPGYLVLATLAPTLMALFGTGYVSGAPSLAILAVAMLLASAAGPLDVALLMAGRSAMSLLNTAVALAVDIVGCLLLLPHLGVTGAALAWAAAIVVRNLLTLEQTRRVLQLSATSRELAQVVTLALGCVGVVPGALAIVGAPTALVASAAAGGVAAYGGALWWRRSLLMSPSAAGPRTG